MASSPAVVSFDTVTLRLVWLWARVGCHPPSGPRRHPLILSISGPWASKRVTQYAPSLECRLLISAVPPRIPILSPQLGSSRLLLFFASFHDFCQKGNRTCCLRVWKVCLWPEGTIAPSVAVHFSHELVFNWRGRWRWRWRWPSPQLPQ